MTLLNRPSNGHVPSYLAMLRALRTVEGLTRTSLESLCAGVADDDQKVFKGTVATWLQLGLLSSGDDDGGEVRLAPPFAQIDPKDIEAIRAATLRLLLSEGNCTNLLGPDDEEGNSRASDFVRLAAWALAQDPVAALSWNQDAVLELGNKQGLELFRGDGRWPSFLEWAYFTGLGLPIAAGFLLNPACAIRDCLRDTRMRKMLKPGAPVSLGEFLKTLSDELPILEGGVYRGQVESKMQHDRYEAGELSPCLGIALFQLQHEREIILQDTPGDVTTRFSLLDRRRHVLKSYTHIGRGVPWAQQATPGTVAHGGA